MSLFKFPERLRPVPDDFAEQCAQTPSRWALRSHYRTCGRSIDRWMAECGLTHPAKLVRPPSRKCSVCSKRISRASATGLCLAHYYAIIGNKAEGPAPRPKVFVADIIAHASDIFGVRIADITGPARLRRYARPRMTCAYLAHLLTPLSYPAIGRALGGRDHSTIMHACAMVPIYMARDEAFAAKVDLVECRACSDTGMAELIAISQRIEAQIAQREAKLAAEESARKQAALAKWTKPAKRPLVEIVRENTLLRRVEKIDAIPVTMAMRRNDFMSRDNPDDAHEFHAMMAQGSAALRDAIHNARLVAA